MLSPAFRTAIIAGLAGSGGTTCLALAAVYQHLFWWLLAAGAVLGFITIVLPLLPAPASNNPAQRLFEGAPTARGLWAGTLGFVLFQAVAFAITKPAQVAAEPFPMAPDLVTALSVAHISSVTFVTVPLGILVGAAVLPNHPSIWRAVPWMLVGLVVPAVIANAASLLAGPSQRWDLLNAEPVWAILASAAVVAVVVCAVQVLGALGRQFVLRFLQPAKTQG